VEAMQKSTGRRKAKYTVAYKQWNARKETEMNCKITDKQVISLYGFNLSFIKVKLKPSKTRQHVFKRYIWK
jgi:hypothetical protein